jgi:glycosyltransferase involved in cell wall biosynthesis
MLFVSYPMLPVSDASCGGAEQMLWTLERELARRGHKTTVAACKGSQISGELINTGDAPTVNDGFEKRAADHSREVLRTVRKHEFDLVHDKSGFFWRFAAEIDVPVLATLHLPRSFYPEELFEFIPENVHFNCVSDSQAQEFADVPGMTGVVPNGIAIERFPYEPNKSDYVLWLGRICPEKAPHLAMDAAERAGVRLVMAGQVYPFSWHREYFDKEIKPRLERAREMVQWVGTPTFAEKVSLLAKARAVLLSTLAPETSSLVAMEAMACGTPVLAFPRGALPEIVRHGISGYLVEDFREMAERIRDVNRLWPEEARSIAEGNFSAEIMADGYEAIYQEIASEAREEKELAA